MLNRDHPETQAGRAADAGAHARARRFAVAPMIDWTDRHCRHFHRLLSRNALLYTEMIVADAVLNGDRDRILGYGEGEHPVALQLGGSDPAKLADACRIAADYGYDEINLNCGCPSDRVQSGTFGACLMRTPGVVEKALAAMVRATPVPVTVKCRIGVDDQDSEAALDDLADAALSAGVGTIWVHARKAWLQGLSPKENRDIPPLDYERVFRLKERLPKVFVGLNGGLTTLDAASAALERVDGVMLGRAAYQTPAILADVDRRIFGDPAPAPDLGVVVAAMRAYADGEVSAGTRMTQIVKPMLGLFNGRPGARQWRRILSEGASRPGAGPDLIDEAFASLPAGAADDRRHAEKAA